MPAFVKYDVELHEVMMQKEAYRIMPDHVPEVISYDPATKTLVMQGIHGYSLADFYGESASAVPEKLWHEVRRLVSVLLKNGLIYKDITGYNFILEEETEKVYIIDFEHAAFVSPALPPRSAPPQPPAFVKDFVSGASGVRWNPEFA